MNLINQVTSLIAQADWRKSENRLRLAIFVAVIGAVVAALLLRNLVDLEKVGYLGVVLTVLVATGGLVIPFPSLVTACAASPFLDPPILALVGGTAGTIGELTGYFLGYSGGGFFAKRRLYLRMESWMRRRGWLVLFVVALIPNPIFDVVGIAAGVLRYPVWRFLVFVWMGKLLKFLALAYICRSSIGWLSDLFGV